MTGEEIHRVLDSAGTSRTTKAALCGILMSEVAPHMVNPERSKADRKMTTKGERGTNGVVSYVMVPYSHAFMGDAKKQYSGGQLPNKDNNPYVAVASHVFPAGRAGDPKWQASFTDAVMASRACNYEHADTREAIAPLGLGLLQHVHKAKSPASVTDMFRGARDCIHRVRFIQGRHGSYARQAPFGTQQSRRDPGAGIGCFRRRQPGGRLCALDANTRRESVQSRRVKAMVLPFQLRHVSTSLLGHPLTTMSKEKFGDDSITTHVAPYAEDDPADLSPREDLLVQETRESTVEDDDEPETLLGNVAD